MSVFVQARARATLLAGLAVSVAAALLAGCSGFNQATRGMADALTLYKPEVVQGNFVSREQVEALRPGMTRLQVRDILGTPLVTSLFHGDRWDYVFTLRRQGVAPQRYRLTVHFSGDTLERFDGDDMPSENEFVARIGTPRKAKVPVLEATEEQLARFPQAPAPDAAAAAPDDEAAAPAATSYPPLEPPR